MFNIRDSATESALCTGMILALLWGVGISVRGFFLDAAIPWSEWFLQLTLGMVAAVAIPPLLVRCIDWIAGRVEATRRRMSDLRQA